MIRAATTGDAAAIAAVHVTGWRETYTGLLPDAMLAGLDEGERAQRWARMLGDGETRAFVAEQGGAIIGFASGNPQRDAGLRDGGFAGEIGAIYLLRRAQGLGLGRVLMAAAARDLRDRGFAAASLWALRDNLQARGFYERLGGEIVSAREERRGGTILHELCFGWRELDALTRA